jgi:hypothetical protein
MLGVPIPPALLSHPSSSGTADPDQRISRPQSPTNVSFMSFDEETSPRGWSHKLRQFTFKSSTGKWDLRKGSLPGPELLPAPSLCHEGSFLDFSDRGPENREARMPTLPAKLDRRPLTEKEKAVARRRAQKLEQVCRARW